MDSNLIVMRFRDAVRGSFGFLEPRGFREVADLEHTSPTTATVTYIGKNVGFVLSLDLRDRCVDADVVMVSNGRLRRNWEGGYSANLVSHLVKYAGFRGVGRSNKRTGTDDVDVDGSVDRLAQLLAQFGLTLLEDKPESLPPRAS